MKFVTREKPKVDRVACPWLIRRFIDPQAELLFVPVNQVMMVAEQQGAVPYDVPDVELGHHQGASSFEAFIQKYRLTDPALLQLAKIVRAADTSDRSAAPEGKGLRQIANGWHLLDWSLEKRLEIGFAVYDCLYAACQSRIKTVLFLCPHNAAKSVLAAAYFQARAVDQRLPYRADSAGTEPSEKVSPKVAELLKSEGMEVTGVIPRAVTADDFASADRVISMGCDLSAFDLSGVQVELWDDIPAASQDLLASRNAISARIEQLIEVLESA
jgi:protein-tyrosine-phosphatase